MLGTGLSLMTLLLRSQWYPVVDGERLNLNVEIVLQQAVMKKRPNMPKAAQHVPLIAQTEENSI